VALRTIAPVLIAAALLASCSAESAEPDVPAEPTATSTAGHGGYAGCLAEHGVPAAPGPIAGPPPGVSQQTWDQATQACSSLAPGPGPG